MERQRLPAALWLIAGISSGVIAFYVTDIPTLAVFVIGTVAGVALGLGLVLRPSSALRGVSATMGIVWLIAYGVVTILNLGTPPGEWLSVVWIAVFGAAAAAVSYRRRSRTAWS